MTALKFSPLPSEMPDKNDEWLNRIARCATSCAKTMEARKLRSNPAPAA